MTGALRYRSPNPIEQDPRAVTNRRKADVADFNVGFVERSSDRRSRPVSVIRARARSPAVEWPIRASLREPAYNKVVAAKRQVTRQTVSKWCARFVSDRVGGLLDAPRLMRVLDGRSGQQVSSVSVLGRLSRHSRAVGKSYPDCGSGSRRTDNVDLTSQHQNALFHPGPVRTRSFPGRQNIQSLTVVAHFESGHPAGVNIADSYT